MTTYILRRLLQSLVVLMFVTSDRVFRHAAAAGRSLVDLRGPERPDWKPCRRKCSTSCGPNSAWTSPFSSNMSIGFGTCSTVISALPFFTGKKSANLMLERFPVTLHLGLLSLVLGGFFGVLIGLLAAVRRGSGSWTELITPLTYFGLTIPVFWLGILLIYIFGLKLRWLPIAGYTSPLDNFWLSTRQAGHARHLPGGFRPGRQRPPNALQHAGNDPTGLYSHRLVQRTFRTTGSSSSMP